MADELTALRARVAELERERDELLATVKCDAECAQERESENDAFQKRARAAEARIAELEASSRWIPCLERMPERGLVVLVTYKTNGGDHRVTLGMNVTGEMVHAEDEDDVLDTALAWRPLPDPWRG